MYLKSAFMFASLVIFTSLNSAFAQGYGPQTAPYPDVSCYYTSGYGSALYIKTLDIDFSKNIATLTTGTKGQSTKYKMTTYKVYSGPFDYEITFNVEYSKWDFGISYTYGNYGHSSKMNLVELDSGRHWNCSKK